MSSIIKVLQPSGILNGISTNQLRCDISDLVGSGVDIVLIDLQDVMFIDSSGARISPKRLSLNGVS